MVMEKPIRKTGIPLSEMTRNIGEKPRQKPPVFIPADQLAVVNLLTDILNELKGIRKKI